MLTAKDVDLVAQDKAARREVEMATKLPDLSLDGLSVADLNWLHEEMVRLRKHLSDLEEKAGPFSVVNNGIRYAKQPGAAVLALSDWTHQQVLRCVEAMEAAKPADEVERDWRIEVLMLHFAAGNDWPKVAALLAEVMPERRTGSIVAGRDRLDDGINLLHTVWLAMAGDTMDPGAFAQDRQAVVDTIWQGLRKLEEAKAQLGAAAEGKSA